MKAQHFLCPVAALLEDKESSDEQKRYYGANKNDAASTNDAQIKNFMGLIWIISFILSLVGMFKAFSCGSNPTNFGLTGTGWGVIILVLGLLVTPVGGLLGISFAIAGSCMSVPGGVSGALFDL